MKIGLNSKLLLFTLLLAVCNVSAQLANYGNLYVHPNTTLSVFENFENKPEGEVYNDGVLEIHANFNNDGAVTSLSNVGYTQFLGESNQIISSGEDTLPIELDNVVFRNKGTELRGVINVAGTVQFIEGVVHNAENPNDESFTFKVTSQSDNQSDYSHVDGAVTVLGKDFEFPVGESGFHRGLAIAPAIGEEISRGDSYTTEYFYKNSNVSAPHISKETLIDFIDDKEYWNIKSNVKKPNTVLMLTWHPATTSSELLRNVEGTVIKVVRWDSTKKLWVVEPTDISPSNNKFTATMTGYGIFTLARVFEDIADEILVYNGISPDDDGLNDYFLISGLEKFPNNTLQIYNRWGAKVYETTGYGSNANWFKGIAEGKAIVNKGQKLPSGTYFYILEYKTPAGKRKERTGYLYIN